MVQLSASCGLLGIIHFLCCSVIAETEHQYEVFIYGEPYKKNYFISPGFPAGVHGYQMYGESYLYLLQCTSLQKCYIRLLFDDWSISPSSIIIINGERQNLDKGRPFYTSMGASLKLVFMTGVNMDRMPWLGFNASYSFQSSSAWPDRPTKDCGSHFHSLRGGYFSDDYDCTPQKMVDCLWVISPHSLSGQYRPFVWLRVEAVLGKEQGYLEVREGNHSGAYLIKSINFGGMSLRSDAITQEFHSQFGFYVRLRAQCTGHQRMSAVFTSKVKAISDRNGQVTCSESSDYLCANHFCIASTLLCDGYDHCGDATDEINCQTTTNKCARPFTCQQSGTTYCDWQKCNGEFDCEDETDERNCSGVTTAPAGDSFHLGLILPVILICVVLSIVICAMVGYYTRRKARHRNLEARRAANVNTLVQAGPTIQSPTTDVAYPDAPPSYEEATSGVTNDNAINNRLQGGMVNLAYQRTDSQDYMVQPPAYTSSLPGAQVSHNVYDSRPSTIRDPVPVSTIQPGGSAMHRHVPPITPAIELHGTRQPLRVENGQHAHVNPGYVTHDVSEEAADKAEAVHPATGADGECAPVKQKDEWPEQERIHERSSHERRSTDRHEPLDNDRGDHSRSHNGQYSQSDNDYVYTHTQPAIPSPTSPDTLSSLAGQGALQINPPSASYV